MIAELWADVWGTMAWDIRSAFISTPDSRYIHAALRARVMANARCRCYLCEKTGDEDTGPDGRGWHIDHIVPLSKGGRTALSNLALSCATCNQRKAAR